MTINRLRWTAICVVIAVTVLLVARSAAAQDTPQTGTSQQATPTQPMPAQPAPAQTSQQAKQTPQQAAAQKTSEEKGTSNDRLFWTLPNFLTVDYEGQYPPLSVGQKFGVVARSSFDYVEYPWYALLAGISQAENSEPGYGQGAEGYGKRYGAAFADGTIENFMTGAIYPSLLRQDPRFYQLGRGGFLHRAGYAVSRIFITRSDSGAKEFNFSEILGSASAASISTYSYHPSADKTLSNTASVWGTEIGYDTVTLVVKEFWPDIQRKFQKKKDKTSAAD
jgi:hypothetical protein